MMLANPVGKGRPPQHCADGSGGEGHREPRRRSFRGNAQPTPDEGQFQGPQEVGVTLDPLAGVEDQPVAFQQVADVAEADEGVVGQEPGHLRQSAQQPQPGQVGQADRQAMFRLSGYIRHPHTGTAYSTSRIAPSQVRPSPGIHCPVLISAMPYSGNGTSAKHIPVVIKP